MQNKVLFYEIFNTFKNVTRSLLVIYEKQGFIYKNKSPLKLINELFYEV